MGKCPNCGNKALLLKTTTCRICSKEGCPKCMTYLFTIPSKKETWHCHTARCFDKFVKRITDNISLEDLQQSLYARRLPVFGFIHKTIGWENQIENPNPELFKRLTAEAESIRDALRANKSRT
jgi:hypothetical protein